MLSKDQSIEWLRRRTEGYRSGENGARNLVEELGHDGKLGQGFEPVDRLEAMDIGDGNKPRPTYVNAGLPQDQKDEVRSLV
jgi:hypothetical protein